MTKEIDILFCDSGCVNEFPIETNYDFCPSCGEDLTKGKQKLSSGRTIQLHQYNEKDQLTDIFEFDLKPDEIGACLHIEKVLEDERNKRVEIVLQKNS